MHYSILNFHDIFHNINLVSATITDKETDIEGKKKEEIRKIDPVITMAEPFAQMIATCSEKYEECSQWKIETTATIPQVYDDMELENRRKHQNEIELGVIQRSQKDPNPSIYDYRYVNETGEIDQHKGTKKMSKYQSCIPRLDELFRFLPVDLGFDVEIKYCDCENIRKNLGYMDRDEFTDLILQEVFKYCGERKMFFSSNKSKRVYHSSCCYKFYLFLFVFSI